VNCRSPRRRRARGRAEDPRSRGARADRQGAAGTGAARGRGPRPGGLARARPRRRGQRAGQARRERRRRRTGRRPRRAARDVARAADRPPAPGARLRPDAPRDRVGRAGHDEDGDALPRAAHGRRHRARHRRSVPRVEVDDARSTSGSSPRRRATGSTCGR
jgi:hypothetical protein